LIYLLPMSAWLRFFRVVNLPTVPGDVLVGAGAFVFGVVNARRTVAYDASAGLRLALFAAAASVFLYMFGLADNDIVGAKKDGSERPIPAGEISLGAARLARGLCLFAAMAVGAVADLPPLWWMVAFALTLAIVLYNRTKWSVAMGLCRALNVASGVAALVVSESWRNDIPVGTMEDLLVSALFWLPVVMLWWLYITIVTAYSTGEETDPAKRRRVGFLIGAIVYLQLGALLFFYCKSVPCAALRTMLLIGAGLLIVLRLTKRALPKVSAS